MIEKDEFCNKSHFQQVRLFVVDEDDSGEKENRHPLDLGIAFFHNIDDVTCRVNLIHPRADCNQDPLTVA
jgi:hypothetical protein